MSNKKKYLLLVGILIIASFLRLYHITSTPPGLYQDEAADGNNALENVHTGTMKVFYTEDNGREGLYVNIVTALIATTGVHEPWVVRLPAAIFGILTVLGMFFLGRELFGESTKHQITNTKQITNSNDQNPKRSGIWDLEFGISRGDSIGLLSAFLLATSFWHINFSRIGFRAIMAPFFLIWALWFFLRAIRSQNPKLHIPYSILAGIAYGAGFYSYIAYRVTPLLFLLFIPYFRQHKNFWRAFLIFAGVTFIVALPIGIYFLQHPADFTGRTSQISVFSSGSPIATIALNTAKTLAMFNFRGDWNWRHNVSGSPELFWPVGILFLIGIILGIKRMINPKSQAPNHKQVPNSNNQTFGISDFGHWNLFGIWKLEFGILLLFSMFLLALLPVVISNEGIPHALRSILLLPPAILFAALGGVHAYRWLKKYMRSSHLNALAGILLLLFVAQAYVGYFVVWAENPNVPDAFNAEYVRIGHAINMLPREMPKYVVVKAGGVDVRGIPMPAQPTIFITDTFLPAERAAKSVNYILPQDKNRIPRNAAVFYLK